MFVAVLVVCVVVEVGHQQACGHETRRAARKKDPRAQYNIGLCEYLAAYPSGSAPPNTGHPTGLGYMLQSARQGYLQAQYQAGSWLDAGGDHDAATGWYRAAGSRGHAKALHNLAVNFISGQ
eukprot:gene24348-17455_t